MPRIYLTKPKVPCSFAGCRNFSEAKGLCYAHWRQQRRGDKLKPLRKKPGSPTIIEYDEVPCPRADLEGPCHIFKGGKGCGGYGRVGIGRKSTLVHRYVWERDVGPIPEGMEIDHQCRNRGCCNVKHLRVVTDKVNATENIVGGIAEKRRNMTHCRRGHHFDEENTIIRLNGWRYCRICRTAARVRRKEKLRR